MEEKKPSRPKYIRGLMTRPVAPMDRPVKREKSLMLLSSLKGMVLREPLVFDTVVSRAGFVKRLDDLLLRILQAELEIAAHETLHLLRYLEEHARPSHLTAAGRILELVHLILTHRGGR